MKKTGLFVLIFLITIQIISAVDISLSKENYQPQETLQAEITGNFPEGLELENIFLYKQGTPRPMPVIYDLKQYQGIYYLYMILPNQEGNFSVQIENTKYIETGASKTDTIIKEFIVQQTNEPAISINPGFVSATQNFLVKTAGIYVGQDVNAELQASAESYGFFLPDGVKEELEFSIKDLESQKTNLKINDYNIPVFIDNEIILPIEPPECSPNCTDKDCGDNGCGGSCGICETGKYCDFNICLNEEDIALCQDECSLNEKKCFGNFLKTCGNYDIDACLEYGDIIQCTQGCLNQECRNQTEIEPEIEEEIKLKFQRADLSIIKSLTARIMVKQDTLLQIILKNTGTKDLKDIKISANFETKLKPKKLDLKKGEQTVINLTINFDESDVDAKNRMSGEIKAKIEDKEFIFPVFIELTFNKSEVILTGTSTTESLHCSDIGIKCLENQICEGDLVSSLEGPCCNSFCKEKKKPASRWIIGLFILSIVLMLIGIVYLRIKRKPKISPKDLLEKKTKEFQSRMKGDEVSGGLGKV